MNGAVILKHRLNTNDREVVQQITENSYLQYFAGLPGSQKKAPFDASPLVSIRKLLETEVLDAFNTLVLEHTEVIGKKGGSSAKKKGNGEAEKSEACGKDQSPAEEASAHSGVADEGRDGERTADCFSDGCEAAEGLSRQQGMLKDGFSPVHTLSWDAFHFVMNLENLAEAGEAAPFGSLFEAVGCAAGHWAAHSRLANAVPG